MTGNFNNLVQQKAALLKHADSLRADQKEIIRKALRLAEAAHFGQMRDEGGPYVIHPVRAANWLWHEAKVKDADLLSAALLHDVVEDCPEMNLFIIKREFGEKICELVKKMTRVRPLCETETHKIRSKAEKFNEHLRQSKESRLIKCADILDNMRSWPYVWRANPSFKKFPRWLNEAERHYIPLAKITGKKVEAEMRKILAKVRELIKKSSR